MPYPWQDNQYSCHHWRDSHQEDSLQVWSFWFPRGSSFSERGETISRVWSILEKGWSAGKNYSYAPQNSSIILILRPFLLLEVSLMIMSFNPLLRCYQAAAFPGKLWILSLRKWAFVKVQLRMVSCISLVILKKMMALFDYFLFRWIVWSEGWQWNLCLERWGVGGGRQDKGEKVCPWDLNHHDGWWGNQALCLSGVYVGIFIDKDLIPGTFESFRMD